MKRDCLSDVPGTAVGAAVVGAATATAATAGAATAGAATAEEPACRRCVLCMSDAGRDEEVEARAEAVAEGEAVDIFS